MESLEQQLEQERIEREHQEQSEQALDTDDLLYRAVGQSQQAKSAQEISNDDRKAKDEEPAMTMEISFTEREKSEALNRYLQLQVGLGGAAQFLQAQKDRETVNQLIDMQYEAMTSDQRQALREDLESRHGREGQALTEKGVRYFMRLEAQERAGVAPTREEKAFFAARGDPKYAIEQTGLYKMRDREPDHTQDQSRQHEHPQHTQERDR